MANNQLIASDNFASGSLAAGWAAWAGESECAITSAPHYAQPTGANTQCGQIWSALTWPIDQISEATIQTLNTTGTNSLDLFVRWVGVNIGYQAVITHSNAVAQLQVFVNNSGAGVQIGSTVSGLTIASGDVFTFGAFGSVITVYQNGNRIFYIGNATIASGGAPGFALTGTTAATNAQVSSWRGYSAVQQDGIWTKQGVIFAASANEVANGSANVGTGVTPFQSVRYEGGGVIFAGTVYKCYYTNYQGQNYAESQDGKTWTRWTSNPMIANYTNPTNFKYNGVYYNWSQQIAAIVTGNWYMRTSTDGVTWSAAQETNITGYYPVIVFDVINGKFYGLASVLNGTNSAPNTYLFTSPVSDGLTWTIQNGGNPVIANIFGTDAFVNIINGVYYNWCTANQTGQGNATASGFDPFETVLYSSTQANVIAGGAWTKVHHSIHNTDLWASLNSPSAGSYAISLIQLGNQVAMYYIGSPGDSTGPQVYQGGLALGPVGSTLAGIVAKPEDATVQIASDAFTSGLGDLSANWITPTSATKLKIVAGPYVEPTVLSTNCCMLYTGAAFLEQQYSEITIQTLTGTLNDQYIEPVVLGQTGSLSFYSVQLTTPTGTISSAGEFVFQKVVNGVFSTIGPSSKQITLSVGDVIRLAATVGSDGSIVLTLYQNGFQVLQCQDYAATFISGYPGVYMFASQALADAQISSWAGGNASVIPAYSQSSASWLTTALANSLRGLKH